MKKLFFILLGLMFILPACDESTSDSDIVQQIYEIKFRNTHFPDTTYELTQDTYISSLHASTNYFDENFLEISESSTNQRRALINFWIAGYLPAEAVVTRAVLTFYLNDFVPEVSGESVAVHIYPLETDWMQSYVTWQLIDPMFPWDNSGGDYSESGLMDTVNLTMDDDRTYIDFELDPDFIELMVKDSNSTYGFLIKLSEDDQSVVNFASSDATLLQPLLTVYYY